MKKRFFSIVLMLTMLLSAFNITSLTAFAFGNTDIKNFAIGKADGKVTILNDISKDFDLSRVDNPLYSYLGVGATYVEYKVKGADDSTYTDNRPLYAGTYTVRVTVAEDANYNEAFATADFTIRQIPVTVTAVNASKVYGDKDGELTYNTVGVLTDYPLNDITVTREKGDDVGEYGIIVSQPEGANPNYNVTFVNGKFEITRKKIDKKDVVVTLGDALTENGKEQTQEVKSVKAGDEELTFTVEGNKATKPGTYELTITLTGNYEGEIAHNFTIAPNEGKDIGDINIGTDENASKAELNNNNNKSEVVKKPAANEQNGTADNNGGKTSPQTGDTSSVALWIFLLCISGATLTLTGLYVKKKRMSR